MSSKPFDDPRLAAGGPGIQYVIEGETHTITPQSPGPSWGMDYITKQGLENDTAKFHTNYQGATRQSTRSKRLYRLGSYAL